MAVPVAFLARIRMFLLIPAVASLSVLPAFSQDEVPVTIKELDLEDAIREFQGFQKELQRFRNEISAGRTLAIETGQILEDLRRTASAENSYNEEAILAAIGGYVDGVIAKQVDLVDFLDSQRYRISYYAAKMASSIRPEDLDLLFGSEKQNVQAIEARVAGVAESRKSIAEFIDALPENAFDRQSFRPLPAMSQADRRKLDSLSYRYQEERNAVDVAKKRLQLVRQAHRATGGGIKVPQLDADLLIGQMFGSLDRIRLQMSFDLLYLEDLLTRSAQSARTQEILQAFQQLVELQGDLEGPSPELAGVLDWLQDSSSRRIELGAASFSRTGIPIPRASELLREAYQGARAEE